jgi:uncharacterized protein (TIGR02246 family)
MLRSTVLVLLTPFAATIVSAQSPQDEQAIKAQLAIFYEGWNAHDVDKMVSVYADDIDHINTYGEWHKGKAEIREDIAKLHASGRNVQKTYSVEKIRFLKPDIAVIQVRSLSTVGNIGTYVMTRQNGKWLTVSFTNVGYSLTPKAGEKP